MVNKMWYGTFSTAIMASSALKVFRHKHLNESLSLTVDDERVLIPNDIESIIVLNISSYMAGADLWGTRKEDAYTAPSFNDGLVEVVGVTGVSHLARIQAGVGHGVRLAQGSKVAIGINADARLAMQCDGEPWKQPATTITITHHSTSPMAVAALSAADSSSHTGLGRGATRVKSFPSISFASTQRKMRGSLCEGNVECEETESILKSLTDERLEELTQLIRRNVKAPSQKTSECAVYGEDIVDYLLIELKTSNRFASFSVASKLYMSGFISPLSKHIKAFRDGRILYTFQSPLSRSSMSLTSSLDPPALERLLHTIMVSHPETVSTVHSFLYSMRAQASSAHSSIAPI
jgi:hypothetical protein